MRPALSLRRDANAPEAPAVLTHHPKPASAFASPPPSFPEDDELHTPPPASQGDRSLLGALSQPSFAPLPADAGGDTTTPMLKKAVLQPALQIFCGPMFSGKTSALLRAVKAHPAGRSVLIKSVIDSRTPGLVRSHAGEALPADLVCASADLAHLPVQPGMLIALDEAQFMSAEALSSLAERVLAANATLILAGLDRGYTGDPFGDGGVLALARSAAGWPAGTAVVTQLTSVCGVAGCSIPATRTQRVAGGDAAVQVGGSESYRPACEKHHIPVAMSLAEWTARCSSAV